MLWVCSCIPMRVTDYENDRTHEMRDSLQNGRAEDAVRLLEDDYMIVPDFQRFAIADDIQKRHASIRVASKRPMTLRLTSVKLTNASSGATIAGDTSETITTRVPWAYEYYPYDDVPYRHYEDRVLVFRHTDERLAAFGSPDRLQLDVTYRIDGDDTEHTEQFDLELVRKIRWVTE